MNAAAGEVGGCTVIWCMVVLVNEAANVLDG